MGRERIGAFGGTFDPIHLGHVGAAREIQRSFQLDKVLFIPAYLPPHKGRPDMAAPEHRMRMVELALAPYPRLVPSAVEMEAGGKSYSVLTLERLKGLYPRAWIFFILGIDAFLEIETWREYRKLLNQGRFIVISRPGFALHRAEGVLGDEYSKRMVFLSASEDVEESLLARFRIFLFPVTPVDVASHVIRERVRSGLPLRGMVPEKVEAYIKEKKLYRREKQEDS